MASQTVQYLAAAGTTGNNTGDWVALKTNQDVEAVACQFVVEAAGATPTVTWKIQGSLDATNAYDLSYVTDSTDTAATATRQATATGAQVNFLNKGPGESRAYKYFRVVTTSNTNITYRCELIAYSEEQ